MEFLDKVTNILIVFAVILVIIILIGAAAYLLYKRKRKPYKGTYDSTDYSGLAREDSKDYLKIDDIIENVIIANNWTRFIGVIDCVGFDFYSMSAREQFSVMNNYGVFINTIDGPITYRQYNCSADMEDTIIRYTDALKKVLAELEEVFLRIDELCKIDKSMFSADDTEVYEQSMASLSKRLDVLEFRRLHILDQLRYIEQYSGTNTVPLLFQTYVFEWTTALLDAADSMTHEELFQKASTELQTIASNKIHALNGCGVKARRCGYDELIDMFRRNSLPVSSERFKKNDLKKIEFDADIITSESIQQFRAKINEEQKKELSKQSEQILFDIITNPDSIPLSDTEDEIFSDLSDVLTQGANK